MVCRGPERLYCRSREAPAGRDAPARRTAEAAHANRVPRPPRLRRRRRGSGPPVLSTPAASTIPRGRTLSARPRLHRRVRLLPAPLPYTPLTIPMKLPGSGALPDWVRAACVRRRAHGARLVAASMMLGLSALTFAPASFIVSLSYSKASKMVRTRVTFENPPADPRPARRALRARALRRRRAELRRCEIFAWPLARTDERPAAANDRRSPRRALSAGPDTHTRDVKPYCEERALYDRRARIAGEGEDAHQPRGDRPRRRRQVDDDGSLDLQMRRH